MLAKWFTLPGLWLYTVVCWRGRVQVAHNTRSQIGYQGKIIIGEDINKSDVANRTMIGNKRETRGPRGRKCEMKVLSANQKWPMVKRLLATQWQYGRVQKGERICDKQVKPTYVEEVLKSQTAELIVAYDFKSKIQLSGRWCGFAVVESDASSLMLLCDREGLWAEKLLKEAEARSESKFSHPHPMFVKASQQRVSFYEAHGYSSWQGASEDAGSQLTMAKWLSKCQISVIRPYEKEAMVARLMEDHEGVADSIKAAWICQEKLQPLYIELSLMACLTGETAETTDLIVAYATEPEQWCGFAVVEHRERFSTLEILCSVVPGWGTRLLKQAEARSKEQITAPHAMYLKTANQGLVEFYTNRGYHQTLENPQDKDQVEMEKKLYPAQSLDPMHKELHKGNLLSL